MFFRKKKVPYWLKMINGMDLKIGVNQLIDFYGSSFFDRSSPIVLPDEFLSPKKQDMNKFLHKLTEYLAKQARIDAVVKIKINYNQSVGDFLKRSNTPISFQEEGMAAGSFHYVDESGEALISINKNQLKNYRTLLGTICHELAHVQMHLNRPLYGEIWNDKTEEDFTDMMAILLGFGLFIINSKESFKASTDYSGSSWEHSKLGYISLEEACFIQGIVAERYGQNFMLYEKLLDRMPRRFFNESIKFIKAEYRGQRPIYKKQDEAESDEFVSNLTSRIKNNSLNELWKKD